MAPHRPPTEATDPLGYTDPRVPRQTQAATTLHRSLPPPHLDHLRTGLLLAAGSHYQFWKLEPHPSGPILDNPIEGIVKAGIAGIEFNTESTCPISSPQPWLPVNGQILLGGSEKEGFV